MQRIAIAAVLWLLPVSLCAQWLDWRTPGIPRTAEGKPNLAAPAPRAADGKPDFSGLWEPSTAGGNSAPVAGAAALAPEFTNIAARLTGPLPYRPATLELVKARQADNGKGNPDGLCLPLGM